MYDMKDSTLFSPHSLFPFPFPAGHQCYPPLLLLHLLNVFEDVLMDPLVVSEEEAQVGIDRKSKHAPHKLTPLPINTIQMP